jgi:predicted aminopeptidase
MKMDLRKEFEKETGCDCYAYTQEYAGAKTYRDGFNDNYVEWLESKVNNGVLSDVSKQSELLKAFIDFYNYRNTGDKTINNDEIEIFIDSL